MMLIKQLNIADYTTTFAAMRAFTENRDSNTPDELWLCEHNAVYTQGVAGKAEHLLTPGTIPVVQSNRGGQITYHGPGQSVVYPLVDLKRLGIYVKEYVFRIEQAVLKTLEGYGITGHRINNAPGIYIRLADPGGHAMLPAPPPGEDPFAGLGKIAALGIKVSKHCTYHGVALNVAMDLAPFSAINPCGYRGLQTVDLCSLGIQTTVTEASMRLAGHLRGYLALA
jgi:lipoyl(octanoyl) transferase